jgi:hypothetical protein
MAAKKRVTASQVRAYPGGRYPSSDWGGKTSPPRSRTPGGYDALGGARPAKKGRVPKK